MTMTAHVRSPPQPQQAAPLLPSALPVAAPRRPASAAAARSSRAVAAAAAGSVPLSRPASPPRASDVLGYSYPGHQAAASGTPTASATDGSAQPAFPTWSSFAPAASPSSSTASPASVSSSSAEAPRLRPPQANSAPPSRAASPAPLSSSAAAQQYSPPFSSTQPDLSHFSLSSFGSSTSGAASSASSHSGAASTLSPSSLSAAHRRRAQTPPAVLRGASPFPASAHDGSSSPAATAGVHTDVDAVVSAGDTDAEEKSAASPIATPVAAAEPAASSSAALSVSPPSPSSPSSSPASARPSSPPPLFSPTFSHPPGVLIKQGVLRKQTASGPRPVFIRVTAQPLCIVEYASESSAKPSAVHHPDASWSFGHNPNRLFILLRSALFNVVLICSSAAEHAEWRQALLKVQAAIDAEEEQREIAEQKELARQRETPASDEEQRRRLQLIAERKRQKLDDKQAQRSRSDDRQPAAAPDDRHSPPSPAPSSRVYTGPEKSSDSSSHPPPMSTLSDSRRSYSDTVLVPLSPSSSRTAPGRQSAGAAVSLRTAEDDADDDGTQSRHTNDASESEDSASGDTAARGGSQPRLSAGLPSSSSADPLGLSGGCAPTSAALLGRRSSAQRSLSLDENEMAALSSKRVSPPVRGVSGPEGRKLTDPTPVPSHPSLQQPQPLSGHSPSAQPSSSAAKETEAEEKERLRRAEEAAAVAAKKQKSRNYTKLFNLPDSEELLADYSCAVQRSILLHGRMYVGEHHVCFFSSIFSHKTMIVIPISDILLAASAKVALVFDNALRFFVQVGPLPVPVKVQPADELDDSTTGSSALSKQRVRKSSSGSSGSSGSDRSRKSDASDDSRSAGEDDGGESTAESVEAQTADANGVNETVGAPAAPVQRFALSSATTMTASFTLTAEQIAFLISLNHSNIVQHFFASFLTRDHALALLETVLKRIHGRDGFTSLSSATPPSAAPSASTSPATQSRSIGKDGGAAVSSGDKERGKKSSSAAMPTALPVSSASSWMAYAASSLGYGTALPAAATAGASEHHQQSALTAGSPTVELPSSLSTSASATADSASSLSDAVAESSAGRPAESAVSGSMAGHPWTAEEDAEDEVNTLAASIDFGADYHPPLGDHRDEEDALLLDTTFPVSLLMFFHLCYADQAPFGLSSYYAQRPTDSDFRMTRWRDISEDQPVDGESEERRHAIEGDLIRHIHYRMQFVTPVGPPVTRVHRIQRWYANELRPAAEGRPCARLDTCSVTPDITFGELVIILERLYVEQLSDSDSSGDGQVRVRVIGGVRFKSRPWKMRPFISLIEQRSRDDSRKGVEDWEHYVKRRLQQEPDRLAKVRRKVERLRHKHGIEQLISKAKPAAVAAQQPQRPASARAAPISHAQSHPAAAQSTAATAVSAASSASVHAHHVPAADSFDRGAAGPLPSSGPDAFTAVLSRLAHRLRSWAPLPGAGSSQRHVVLLLFVAVVCLLLFGASSGLFALSLLCCVAALAAAAEAELRGLRALHNDSREQLQMVTAQLTALVVQMKLDSERQHAEAREER